MISIPRQENSDDHLPLGSASEQRDHPRHVSKIVRVRVSYFYQKLFVRRRINMVLLEHVDVSLQPLLLVQRV